MKTTARLPCGHRRNHHQIQRHPRTLCRRRCYGDLQRSGASRDPSAPSRAHGPEQMRDAIGVLTDKWRRLGHEIGFGIGIAHGHATLGTIGFEGRFDYAAIGTVSNIASRLCDEAKPGRYRISPRVLMAVEDAVTVEPVGEFELEGHSPTDCRLQRPCHRTAKCLSGASADAALKHGSEFTTERSWDIFATYAVTTLARTRRNAANCGVARKTRHVRVRAALCRERHRYRRSQ